MKLSRIFFFAVASVVIVIAANYWIGVGKYVTFTNYYRVQRTTLWKLLTEKENITADYNETCKESGTLGCSILLNQSTTLQNQSKTISNDLHNIHNLRNVSIPVQKKDYPNLYVTFHKLRIARLGNQMFQYASLLGIANTQGRKALLFPGSSLERTFKLTNVEHSHLIKDWTFIHESSPLSCDSRMMDLPPTNIKVVGFFQCMAYFQDITERVRQEFTFRDDIAKAAASIVSDVRSKYRSSLLVGVHVRRGDLLTTSRNDYSIPQMSYFIKAFDWMRNSFPGVNITFIIASDDLEWCKANLVGSDVVTLPPHDPAVHMAALTRCDHVIMTGGTFGWWSGWLAGGKVIYFTGFLTPAHRLGKYLKKETMYPPLWIGLGN